MKLRNFNNLINKIMEKDLKNKANLEINNCTNCPFHKVLPDPDPNDWFNYDDIKVVCIKAQKEITCACRPYNIKKESEIPDWCPLIKK